jgi:menaquinone-dependent protoporphyrinogen oxidase
MRVLVAYATRHGSTTGIAERLAAKIGEHPARVDLLPVGRVDNVGAYEAVVLGSPVYDQSWASEATEFVVRNRDILADRPVWLFSVGALGDTHRLWGRLVRKEPREIGRLRETVHPRDYRVFAGAIDRSRWPFLSRLLFHALGGRLGDNRDWPEIEAWAHTIGRALRPPPSS